MTRYDVIQLCYKDFLEMKDTLVQRQTYHKGMRCFGVICSLGSDIHCYLLSKRTIYCIEFDSPLPGLMRITVRESNKTIRCSGPISANLFCYNKNISKFKVIGVTVNKISDKKYWTDFFIKYSFLSTHGKP